MSQSTTIHNGAPREACVVSPDHTAERAFGWSIVVSGIRCTLAYVVLPFATPFLGLAPGVGPASGLVIGTVAIVANAYSFRRFRRSVHRWRIPAMTIHVLVIGFMVVLMVIDTSSLIG